MSKSTPGAGHNSGATVGDHRSSVSKEQLLSIVERVERLNEEKKGIAEDIKEVFAEAKANGYDTKVLRRVLALRKQDAAEREEQDAIMDLYCTALGMVW